MPMYIVRLRKLQKYQQRLSRALNKERMSNVDRAIKQSNILFQSNNKENDHSVSTRVLFH